MVHGSGGQQLFLVVAALTIVTSPFIVALLHRRARGVPPDSSVSLLHWLVGPIVTCAMAASVLQLLILEDLAAGQPNLALVIGLAALTNFGWAVLAGRGLRRPDGVGRQRALLGLALSAALAAFAWLAAAGVPASSGEVGVAFFAAVEAIGLLAWVSPAPVRTRLERRRLGFEDAQLGVVLAVLTVVLLVSYVLAGLAHTPTVSQSDLRSSWVSNAAASVTGWPQANERQT